MNLINLVTDPSKLQTFGKYITVQDAYNNLHNGSQNQQLVQCVATDPEYAYKYALIVLKDRFPDGESIISTSENWACWYALNVVKGRFIEGEHAIATNIHFSWLYARHVIKERFPAGEVTIATDPWYAYQYARDVIAGPFPAGEPAINSINYIQELYVELIGI